MIRRGEKGRVNRFCGKTYLCCFADGAGIMVDCYVCESENENCAGKCDAVVQKNGRIKSGKKWGCVPKYFQN